MKLIHKIILLLLCSCQYTFIAAQALPPSSIHLNTDQRVYITGETVWIDGWIDKFFESKTFHLTLFDRFGKKRQEIHLKNEEGSFKGFIPLPNELGSDFYFVEASISGYASFQTLHPIMVINPASAATVCNDSFPLLQKSNSSEQAFTIQTAKSSYNSREKVKIDLSGLDNLNHLQVSVSKKDELTDYMDSLLSYQMPLIHHPARGVAEVEGHHLKIKLLSKETAKPVQRARAYAAVIGGQAALSSALSNTKGEVEFILPLIEQETSLVFFTDKQLENKVRIQLLEEQETTLSIPFPCLQLSPNMATSIEERIWNSKAALLYQGKNRWTFKAKDHDSTDFYGKPDKRYLLDEYVRYPVLEEVIAEFIHEAKVKETGNGTDKTIQVLNTPAKAFFNTQALIMLDGVPLLSVEKLLELNPLLIQSIDVVARKYYLGDTTWNGLIHFKTYNSDLSEFALPPSYILYPFKGIQETANPMLLHTPSNESRLPVLSNLLFHQTIVPEKKSSLQLEFSTNDALGRFQINGKGLNVKGAVVQKQITIDVKERR